MNELMKVENQISTIEDNNEQMRIVEKMEIFTSNLNKNPDVNSVKVNKLANNSKYLPISMIETLLDEYFMGLWNTKNFKYQVVANEITGSIDLEYYHPEAKCWITRTGAGAVPIQFKSKEKGGTGLITDINNKITNTLVKDFPHLKAECIKNAAKSISKAFGRDLNRAFEDTYTPIYSDKTDIKYSITEFGEVIDEPIKESIPIKKNESISLEWKDQLESCVDLDEFKDTWNKFLESRPEKEAKIAILPIYNAQLNKLRG